MLANNKFAKMIGKSKKVNFLYISIKMICFEILNILKDEQII